jgi:hypothetical protein
MPKETKYREEYGEQLIEACQQGYSPAGFAGKLGVSRVAVYDWAKRHPEFADAMSRAKAARVEWFETQMRNILVEGGTGGQATLLMFLLRNAGPDDYQDRKEITGAEGKPLIEDSDPARIAASILELLKSEHEKRPRDGDTQATKAELGFET